MESERLLVWLALPGSVMPIRSGLLCRRHADAMIVPRGWTLDDRREAMPRLFKVADAPAPAASANHPSRVRNRTRLAAVDEPNAPRQLELGDPQEAGPEEVVLEPTPEMPLPAGLTVAELHPHDDAVATQTDETKALPWRPLFDDSDDLGGLLKASSPLLSRAFRGRHAPPPEPTEP
ncbi:MAG: hypothetical protein JWN62_1734 [Acidimicrobiales bacterium]|nr:hypothetical protein [Acidimicrobiales bacterium]